jgi:hypothetical protein
MSTDQPESNESSTPFPRRAVSRATPASQDQPPGPTPPLPASEKGALFYPLSPDDEERFKLLPIDSSCSLFAVLENLLKRPGRIIYELRDGRSGAVATALAIILIACIGIYGVMVGCLSGGSQLWIAPTKIAIGSIMAGLICLPSLYIFLCLSGIDAHLRQISAALLATVSLTWLLLIGFAPIAWVFSQSTDSVAFMAFLHLAFWAVAVSFGLRFLPKGADAGSKAGKSNLSVWSLLYIVVSLQMMTSLRPIVGRSNTFLPTEKQFFLAHASKVFFGDVR